MSDHIINQKVAVCFHAHIFDLASILTYSAQFGQAKKVTVTPSGKPKGEVKVV